MRNTEGKPREIKNCVKKLEIMHIDFHTPHPLSSQTFSPLYFS
jgi:ureidoglycolate hydrolase